MDYIFTYFDKYDEKHVEEASFETDSELSDFIDYLSDEGYVAISYEEGRLI